MGRAVGVVELDVVRGLIVVVDTLTGEVLAGKRARYRGGYQSRRPVPGVGDPRDMCQVCPETIHVAICKQVVNPIRIVMLTV